VCVCVCVCDVTPRDFERMLVFYLSSHFENAHKMRQLYTKLNVIISVLLSITNKMQRYTIFFIVVNAVHFIGGETEYIKDTRSHERQK